MRIISGFARGRKLTPPPGKNLTIRPTADRAREALFSILGKTAVKDASVLDLFAGTGALGLEAFSRGAGFVILVDHHPIALHLLKENSAKCLNGYHGPAQIRIVQHDLRAPLLSERLPEEVRNGFDLIFADPPYAKEFSETTLKFINNSSLLKPNGILIVEEKNNVTLPEKLSVLQRYDARFYGDTGFYFYTAID